MKLILPLICITSFMLMSVYGGTLETQAEIANARKDHEAEPLSAINPVKDRCGQELERMKSRAMTTKNLDLPVALHKEVKSVRPTEPSDAGGSLKERLVNTVWIWNRGETITFLPGGKAKWSGGNAPLLTWRVTDNNKRVIEGTSVSGKPYRMTLDATLESGTLTVGGQSERATSRVTAK